MNEMLILERGDEHGSSDHDFRDSQTELRAPQSARPRDVSSGFTLIEMVLVVMTGLVLTAIAIPIINSALASMDVKSMGSAISAGVSNARYQAIQNSQIYTLVVTTPANTYVIKNVATGVSGPTVPLPRPAVTINGGTSATFTFTFCPNGMTYGAGGTCPSGNTPPVLTATYQGRTMTINVSSVGNVTTTMH